MASGVIKASNAFTSNGAVERKFQNVSAILDEAGLPWIDGYKPLSNYQDELARAAGHDFDLVVHSPEQVALLEQWQGAHAFHVWVKVDSGMHRLGFRPEDFGSLHPGGTLGRSGARLGHLAGRSGRDLDAQI